MIKVLNIRYKDKTTKKRLLAVKSFKSHFDTTIKMSAEWVDMLIKDGEINFYDKDMLFGYHKESASRILSSIFECDIIEENIKSNENIDVPNDDTVIALAWYYNLSESDRDKIDLIGKWFNRPCVAVC